MREYAGRDDVLEVPPKLAALLTGRVLPLYGDFQ